MNSYNVFFLFFFVVVVAVVVVVVVVVVSFGKEAQLIRPPSPYI